MERDENELYRKMVIETIDRTLYLNDNGRVLISLGIRCKPYLPQICGLIKHRLHMSSNSIRQEACDLISRIAVVIYECNEIGLLKHLAGVLDELLGEEYPDVLGSILLAY